MLYAQKDNVYIYGSVQDHISGKKVKDFHVTARDTADTTFVIHAMIKGRDEFNVNLPYDRVYRLEFDREGYVQKHALLNLNIPDIQARKEGFGMRLVMNLVPWVEGVDYALCELPFGKAQYDPCAKDMRWDEAYSQGLRPAYKTLAEAIEVSRKSTSSK
ncbi:MAG TPA: hypothetical protein VGE21_01340 [Flavobacteriales bacterium]